MPAPAAGLIVPARAPPGPGVPLTSASATVYPTVKLGPTIGAQASLIRHDHGHLAAPGAELP
jgi:hypothetical protein